METVMSREEQKPDFKVHIRRGFQSTYCLRKSAAKFGTPASSVRYITRQ